MPKIFRTETMVIKIKKIPTTSLELTDKLTQQQTEVLQTVSSNHTIKPGTTQLTTLHMRIQTSSQTHHEDQPLVTSSIEPKLITYINRRKAHDTLAVELNQTNSYKKANTP